MNTDRPAKVRIPPMTQRKSETPAEPETAKMPDGVEKTETLSAMICVVCRERLTSSTDHLVQDDEDSGGIAQFLTVIVDESLVRLYADMVIRIPRSWTLGFVGDLAIILLEFGSHTAAGTQTKL